MTTEKKIFNAKPMKIWLEEAEKLPPIKPLFSPFWNEGETCFFFGSTGVGKTLFAMQMAYIISQSKKVLYFDFEMTERQLVLRFKDRDNLIPFSDNLIRLEMKRDIYSNQTKLLEEVEKEITNHEADVIFIDNITWLITDIQEAKNSIPFMKSISALKRKHGVSVLIIAHTPKRKPTATMSKNGLVTFDNPLDIADMAGSAALNNFIDSCFAIGKSRQEDDIRYLKQLKSRSSEIINGEEKVIVCRLGKTKEGFLGLVSEGLGSEFDHLVKSGDNSDRNQKILELHKQGISTRKIGEKYNMSHTQVRRIISENDDGAK